VHPLPLAAARAATALALALALSARARAQDRATPDDLTELSLESLMELEVTVASRKAESFIDAPAAVYVISGEELRRSGFTSLPEALRMVPGLYVARYDASGWDVTARGKSGGFANDLLVLLDGLEIRTPVFAGTNWELWEIDLADVERIEVIRGPGGSLWGANASNGIVNIVTKHAAETLGGRVTAHVSDEERFLVARYGAPMRSADGAAPDGWWRVWTRAGDHDALRDPGQNAFGTEWTSLKAGFRADWERSNGAALTLHGQAWTLARGERYFVTFPDLTPTIVVEDETPKNGLALHGSYARPTADGGKLELSGSYLRDWYREVDYEQSLDMFDLQVQRDFQAGETHAFTLGGGYRLVRSDLVGDFTYTFDPEEQSNERWWAFAQDTLALAPLPLRLTLAAEVEHNDFTGGEFQPSARLAWDPHPAHTLWAAASRSVRTPSLDEDSIVYNFPVDDMGTFVALVGNDDLLAEEQASYELGWRWNVREDLLLDAAAFYNEVDHLLTMEDGAPYTDGTNVFFPLVIGNKAQGESWGAEVALDWDASERLRLRGAWSALELQTAIDDDSTDVFFSATDSSTPENQVNLRAYYDLAEDWELDGGAYYVEHVPFTQNPTYVRVDARLGWQPSDELALSIGVQNAADPEHPESGPGVEVERNVFLSITWTP
jgi:iron complex outermembrane receptor protein